MNRRRALFIANLIAALLCVRSAPTVKADDMTRSPSPTPPQLPMEYVYIAANSGRSSGGHCGLRFGDRIYHFSVEDDLLLIRREGWQAFLHTYRMLDNRGATIGRFDVSAGAAQQVRQRLDRLYLIQKKHFDRVDALETELQWWQCRKDPASRTLMLPRAGLFDQNPPRNPTAETLTAFIASTLGEDYLATSLRNVESSLANYSGVPAAAHATDLRIDQFPLPFEIPAEQLRDDLALRQALIVLRDAHGLNESATVSPASTPLDNEERKILTEFADKLKTSVARLLESPRPDRGSSVMLAAARYYAVRHSLDTGSWVLLDTLGGMQENHQYSAKEVARHPQVIRKLAEPFGEQWRAHRNERNQSTGSAGIDLYHYNILESDASRYAEPLAALEQGRAMRSLSGSGLLLPEKKGSAFPPDFLIANPGTGIDFRQAQAQANTHKTHNGYRSSVGELYHYSLWNRNCATELARAMIDAFPDKAAAEAALGSLPDRLGPIHFSPAGLMGFFEKNSRLAEVRELPNYRRQQIEPLLMAADSEHHRILTHLRESNTMTSTVYPGAISDSSFLFFADGAVPLRPLQGTANLGYGLLNSGVGILTSPLDRGQRICKGLRGALYSLPELIGIPIRKGRYDVAPSDMETTSAPGPR